jgi:hypothetical protein
LVSVTEVVNFFSKRCHPITTTYSLIVGKKYVAGERIYVSCCTVYKRQKSWEMCVPFYIKLIATGKLDEDEVGQGSGMILYAGLIG